MKILQKAMQLVFFLKKRISDCLLEKRQFLFVRLFNYLFSKRCLLNFYNTELQLKQQYSYGKKLKGNLR